IPLEGHELSVGANLHAALVSVCDGYAERLLWIDAICINQNDLEEKARQVQSMVKVHASAARVVIWLGKSGGRALEDIQLAAARSS
ncbi:heterokaryon incompatibility, partial [Cladorrhinum sp. PSN332]